MQLLSALAVLVAGWALQGCTPSDAEPIEASTPRTAIARGVVDVEGGLVSVRPTHAGLVTDIVATAGQDVLRGAVLARLNGDTEQAEADAARAELQRARAELSSARQREAALQEQMARVREAVQLGAESARVRDELQAQLDAQTSALPVSEASVAAAEARLRAANMIADSATVRAPIDGRVVQVNAHTGDAAGSGDAAAMFLLRPKTALIVRASIPARDATRIHVDSTVSISAIDSDDPALVGRVRSLGELARKPDPTLATDEFSSERVVDCIVALEGTANLRLGSLVLVRF
jgi:multidrug efflux pump subunit AcrA (membrane-fusion protein)